MTPRQGRLMRRGLLAAGAGVVLLCALSAPATTRQGVNFVVATTRIPWHLKMLGFLHRDAEYRLLARQITQGLAGDEARARAVLRWTRDHIVPTPDGWPIIDDHVQHIIIRGHGLDDQMADVFTTLLTYAGVRAFWRPLKLTDGGPILILSFADVEGRWAVFDVARDAIFADEQGRLLDVETLAVDPRWGSGATPWGVPYSAYLARLQPFAVPRILRARQQMPMPRLLYEARRVVGWKRNE